MGQENKNNIKPFTENDDSINYPTSQYIIDSAIRCGSLGIFFGTLETIMSMVKGNELTGGWLRVPVSGAIGAIGGIITATGISASGSDLEKTGSIGVSSIVTICGALGEMADSNMGATKGTLVGSAATVLYVNLSCDESITLTFTICGGFLGRSIGGIPALYAGSITGAVVGIVVGGSLSHYFEGSNSLMSNEGSDTTYRAAIDSKHESIPQEEDVSIVGAAYDDESCA